MTPAAGLARRSAMARLAGALAGTLAVCAWGQPTPRRLEVRASKFEFSPAEIVVKRGQPVTLVLSATDFAHGFGLPDFHLRRDLIPGRVVELTFTPDKAGRFHVLCDNFCGEGHDKMSGWLVVTQD